MGQYNFVRGFKGAYIWGEGGGGWLSYNRDKTENSFNTSLLPILTEFVSAQDKVSLQCLQV